MRNQLYNKNGKLNCKLSMKDIIESKVKSCPYYTGCQEEMFTTQEGRELKIIKISDSDNLHGNGYVLGGVFRNQLSDDSFLIITDDRFAQLPEPVRKFIIDHELGHLYYNNIMDGKPFTVIKEQFKRSLNLSKSLQREFEADCYSMKINGYFKTVNALRYLYDKCDFPKATQKELAFRIRALKEVKDNAPKYTRE